MNCLPFLRWRIALPALLIAVLVHSAFGRVGDVRELRFYHTHTQDELHVIYFENGEYRQDALQALDGFLADWRNEQRHEIDRELLDILWDIQQSTSNDGVFEVISAYRSPETNAMLRQRSSGVARNSQHLHGKAIDVRLRGLETRELRDTALALQRGGVGYYAKSDFVHVDTGRVRSW